MVQGSPVKMKAVPGTSATTRTSLSYWHAKIMYCQEIHNAADESKSRSVVVLANILDEFYSVKADHLNNSDTEYMAGDQALMTILSAQPVAGSADVSSRAQPQLSLKYNSLVRSNRSYGMVLQHAVHV